MAISSKLVQTRLPMVGAIRLGYSEPGHNGGKKPKKLEKFRLTSPSRDVIVEAAGLYGGEPARWASDDGPQWQVLTTADAIDVFVPPQRIDPYLEGWDRKVLQRRCDGETELLRARPCLCLQGCRIPERLQHDFETNLLARGECPCGARRLCKPTTRFSVLLADVHTAGTWKLETHGWNAAAELPGMAEGIANATEPVPAILRLRIQQGARLKVKNGQEEAQPRKFAVPWLDFSGLFTPRQAFAGELSAAARAAIGAPPRTAIGAARATLTETQVLDQAKHLQTPDQVATLRKMAEDGGVLTDRVRAALDAVGADLDEQRQQRAAVNPDRPRPAAAPVKQPPKDVVVDAVLVEDIDRARRLWTETVAAAAKRGRDENYTTERFERRYGYHPADEAKLRVADFEDFLAWVRGGAGKPAADAEGD